MAVDSARAALILQPYRYASQSNAAIKVKYQTTNEIVLDTNLDQAGGEALALALFNATSGYATTFTVPVEDTIYLEDWTGSPNRYTVSFAKHPTPAGKVFTLIASETDFLANRTTLTVRA